MTHTLMPAAVLGNLPPYQSAAVSFLARYDGPTLELYQRYLGRWLDWCQTNGLHPFDDITRGHVELYIRELGERLAASSVGAAMAPVRGYYRWACLDGLIDRDPAAYARLPKIRHKKKPPLDRTDLRRFLATAKEISPRHWALTQLLGVMGLRISEACSLTVEQALHVEQGLRVLHYIGKGSKPAATPIPYQSLAAIDAVIDGRTTGPLIPTRDGRPLSRHGAAGLLRAVNKRAGIGRHINPHYLRALAITQGREAGLTLDEMAAFARHEDVRTTKRHYDLTVTEFGSHPVHAIGARLAV